MDEERNTDWRPSQGLGGADVPQRRFQPGAPDYVLGFALNLFFFGSGFSYINRPWLSLAFLGVVLLFLLMVSLAAFPVILALALYQLLLVGALVVYRNVYMTMYALSASPFTPAPLWFKASVIGFLLIILTLSRILA